MSDTKTKKALLVDFGGVLTTEVWSSFAAFCAERGLDPDAVKSLFRENPDALASLRGLETGEVEPAEFERRFGELLGTDAEGLIEGMFAALQPSEPMIAAVRRAHLAGVPTGLISNSWVMDHYSDEIRALFDAVVISAEVGMHKPQPEIYLLAAERLGVAPSDCIFVDDLRENCTGAEAVGMTAVLHRDPRETIARVEELLDAELTAPA
jgi:putative hydrolase of the HAD superfamily